MISVAAVYDRRWFSKSTPAVTDRRYIFERMSQTIVTTEEPGTGFIPRRGAIHTLSILVNNEPGVLMRICQVFSRRGFNIDSLVVSEGRNANFSRMTIGISGDPQGLDQIIKQVSKLIDVIHCFEHTSADSVTKEMILIKIKCSPEDRSQALQITGDSLKIDAAVAMFSQFEIIETVRTGKVVMARGEQAT